jgi:hypothetical protein
VEDDEELLVRLARLLATLAAEVMDALKKLENGGRQWGIAKKKG